VDPAQTYYRGLAYRNSARFHNATSSDPPPAWDPYGECMDSSQAWFCRDIWVDVARNGVRLIDQPSRPERNVPGKAGGMKRQIEAQDNAEPPANAAVPPAGLPPSDHADANAGSDYDAMPGSSPPPLEGSQTSFAVPNSHFEPARIIINPRCVTTYAGVSHTKLANDLFGPDEDDIVGGYDARKYVMEEWKAAPDSYVCQEQRYTGGRKSPKNQRSSPFSIQSEIEAHAPLL